MTVATVGNEAGLRQRQSRGSPAGRMQPAKTTPGDAEVTAHALLKGKKETNVSDGDPLQAIEDAVRRLKRSSW